MRQPPPSGAGLARTLFVLTAVTAGVTLLARVPAVASWLWPRYGGYPDLAAYHRTIGRSRLPWRPAALRVFTAAVEAGERAASSRDARARAAHQVTCATLARVAIYLLYAPLMAPVVALSWAVGRAIAPAIRSRRLDLEGDLVVLQAVSCLRPAARERALPRPPWISAAYWLAEPERSIYRAALAASRGAGEGEAGAGAAAVAEILQRVPLLRAGEFRTWLREDLANGSGGGFSVEELRAYEAAWKQRPRAGSWLGRVLARGRVRKALRALPERRELAALIEEGVPPILLQVREELRAGGHLTPLRERLLRILAAHPLHPASIDDHEAREGGLLRHELRAVRVILHALGSGQVPQSCSAAVLTLVLGHDIGKVDSYACSDGRWKRLDERHAQNSARILDALPELRAEHPDIDALLLALKLEHLPTEEWLKGQDRGRLERDLGRGVLLAAEELLRWLRIVDRAAWSEDQRTSTTPQSTRDALLQALARVVGDMTINRSIDGGPVDGFYSRHRKETGDEAVLLVLEHRFRELLKLYLPREQQQALQLWGQRVPGQVHPGWRAISTILIEAGAMPTMVRKVPIDGATRLLSAEVGNRVFRGLFPVSLPWLARQLSRDTVGRLQRHWSQGGYELREILSGVRARPSGKKEERGVPAKCPACGERLERTARYLLCAGYQKGACGVKFTLDGDRVLLDCPTCKEPLQVVRPRDRKRPFMGCRNRCKPGDGGGGG